MKILLLDIETAPHLVAAWGLWGQNIPIGNIMKPGYTLCWAAKWLGESEVMFDSVYQSTPKQMLKRIHKLLDEADAVVHYNGTNFDIPTLNKDFAKYRLDPPMPHKNIDLLRTVRSSFRLPSNKLDYVLQYFQLGGKEKHKGMPMWLACMNKEPEAWVEMERYNRADVTELEKLYTFLLPWIKGHPNMSVFYEERICPVCGSNHIHKKGVEVTRAGKYQRYRCMTCKAPFRDNKNQVRAFDKMVQMP